MCVLAVMVPSFTCRSASLGGSGASGSRGRGPCVGVRVFCVSGWMIDWLIVCAHCVCKCIFFNQLINMHLIICTRTDT